MGKKETQTPESAENLDDLDAAFDHALEGLSAANEKVTNVLDTMDNPDAAPPEVEFAEYSDEDASDSDNDEDEEEDESDDDEDDESDDDDEDDDDE